MSLAFLLSPLFVLPYVARATSTLAEATVIPPFHKMVPLTDPTHKDTDLGGGNASRCTEVLNLNCSKPVMPIQWCYATSEITDPHPKSNIIVRSPLAKNKTLLEPQWSNFNHTTVHDWTIHCSLSLHSLERADPHAHARAHLAVKRLCVPLPSVIPIVMWLTRALSDWLLSSLISMQMLLLGLICLPLVYAPLVLLYTGVFAVAIDAAKAVVGFTILITGLGPHRLKSHIIMIRAFTLIDRICLKMIIVCDRLVCSRVCKLFFIGVYVFLYLPCADATGRETPKVTFQDYFLPGVTRWDAIPYHDFRRVWWVALCAALGNISQEGWSLLQTARNEDLGSPGNPGTPAQTVVSENRNQRVFGTILNYIEATSHLYHYVSTTFANDGRGLFTYLYVVGHLPYTHEERTTLDAEWRDATIASVGIKYTPKAVFEWTNYVNVLADKLGKTEHEKRVKYLAGFPSSFDVLVVAERARPGNGSYVHPANYPAHHPQAGDAHPLAGQPDIVATATAFYGEWARMCNEGLIKTIPKGFARRVYSDGDSGSDDEHANMARDRSTPKTVCLVCGGLGHASKVDGVGTCLTAKLGVHVPREHLSQIKYPELLGYKAPYAMWQSKFVRNSNSHSRAQSSNHSRDTSRHGKARMTDAPPPQATWSDESERLANPPWMDEPPLPDEQEFAARLHAQQQSRMRRQHKGPSNRRPNTSRPRARQSDKPPPQSQETPQNSAQDAYESYHESDEDEQGRLAVATGNITFN